ncbi:M64 family metallopeptidase [Streptomyces mirabilis]|uniref:M64 family metallopeptidase n=1 Tax=Streptomyces mirabilis TaxID=68239 RepID=UPI0033C83FB7
MTTVDGNVLGSIKIVDNGPSAARWNLVILGDGYQSGQMAQYAVDAQRITDAILRAHPFNALRAVINVYRVDVTSTSSGADDPIVCGGSGAIASTYFDASFCGDGSIRRQLVANAGTALNVANAQVPRWHAILMIVNSAVYGGSGGAIAVISLAAGSEEIALHELGHVCGLGDEYEYYRGCTSGETNRNNHPAVEPHYANVTIDRNRSTIKWRDLILPTTPVPTTKNPNCTQCDPLGSPPPPLPADAVGAFEGADTFHCGAYRPQFDCKMRALGFPFCVVCQRQIARSIGITPVPDVLETSTAGAARAIRDAGLEPVFKGTDGPGAWVWRQHPPPDSIAKYGSEVQVVLRTGPIP